MKTKQFLLSIACWAVLAAAGHAQQAGFVKVDCIAAVVDRSPIPCSRLEEQLNVLRRQGEDIPADSAELAEFRRQLLDRLIEDELLVQAALRDTAIEISEQEVQSAADQAIREIRQGFASELEFQRQLRQAGFATADDYRGWMAEQKRRDLLKEALRSELTRRGELDPLPPTEREMREAFEQVRGQQQRRPATVSFRQIVVAPQPDTAALRKAYARADSVREALLAGADFAEMARKWSDDVGTRENGGELGWVRRGVLVPEFERVAFSIKPGVISVPVRTSFGVHIIEVQRSTPAEVQVRHILISPEITDENRALARSEVERLAESLRAGASFDSLARRYRDPEEESLVEQVPREKLPPAYRAALQSAEPGDIIAPVELVDAAGRTKYAVILFDRERPEGEITFEDVRDVIRAQLTETNAITRYVRRLKESAYIDVRIP
ncbi:MAG: peptidylprolyl isomerase [Gemmatimonadales bacterium]